MATACRLDSDLSCSCCLFVVHDAVKLCCRLCRCRVHRIWRCPTMTSLQGHCSWVNRTNLVVRLTRLYYCYGFSIINTRHCYAMLSCALCPCLCQQQPRGTFSSEVSGSQSTGPQRRRWGFSKVRLFAIATPRPWTPFALQQHRRYLCHSYNEYGEQCCCTSSAFLRRHCHLRSSFFFCLF